MLHRQALHQIHGSGFDFDPLITNPTDTRRGLTLLFRPGSNVLDSIQDFIDKVREISPDHYFYRNSDIHVTVMPIISCYDGFVFDKINSEDYIQVINDCLKNLPSFDVEFRGVFFSPSCIIVKGYPLDDTLEKIRTNLRREFPKFSLEQSLDKRYILRTAHSTVVRFQNAIQDPKKMENFVASKAELDFGTSTIDKLSFVYNDWYQRHERVTVLKDFFLT